MSFTWRTDPRRPLRRAVDTARRAPLVGPDHRPIPAPHAVESATRRGTACRAGDLTRQHPTTSTDEGVVVGCSQDRSIPMPRIPKPTYLAHPGELLGSTDPLDLHVCIVECCDRWLARRDLLDAVLIQSIERLRRQADAEVDALTGGVAA